jgi:hypothetical protein
LYYAAPREALPIQFVYTFRPLSHAAGHSASALAAMVCAAAQLLLLTCLLSASTSAFGELRLAVYNTTAFGGPLSSNGTTSGGVSGATTVGCNQSAEYVGSVTVPADATLLGFAADVDSAVSTLRVWVAEFLVLQASTAAAAAPTAKLWYSSERDAVTFCASNQCDVTQKASGYTVLSADEGSVPGQNDGSAIAHLFFSWSGTNNDNWVTNSTACPGASYKSCGNPNGQVYETAAAGRLELVAYSNANGTHHMAAATTAMKAWATAHGYTAQGTLGYLDAPGAIAPKTINRRDCLPYPPNVYIISSFLCNDAAFTKTS